MSKESKILVPDKVEETSDEQRALMLLLNSRVCALFEQKDDILLRPSPDMNRRNLWERLKIVQKNPQAHVGYWFGNRTCADIDGYTWLNVELHLWPVDEAGETQLVFLTPNQTHWVLDALKENEMLRDRLKAYIQDYINNLQEWLGKLSKNVDTGAFWDNTGKWNPVFDVAAPDARHRGHYTSWDIFMANVCPPPPWMYPYPRLQESWMTIRDVGRRPLM